MNAKWTARDEAQLQELYVRRNKVMEENRSAVVAITNNLAERSLDAGEMADRMIEQATLICGALRPFDSTYRVVV
jgi:hypothetical protein